MQLSAVVKDLYIIKCLDLGFRPGFKPVPIHKSCLQGLKEALHRKISWSDCPYGSWIRYTLPFQVVALYPEATISMVAFVVDVDYAFPGVSS